METEKLINTYVKYAPHVFIAKCYEEYEKGDDVLMTTKYGKEHWCIIHNLIKEQDGYFYYSITRADGFDSRERARRKAERYESWAKSANKRSNDFYKKAMEHESFLTLGEPVKVGHHSEHRHRKLIENADRNMCKSVREIDKMDEHLKKAEYWEQRAKTDINLSMPKSLNYYKDLLDEAKDYHAKLKSGEIAREHNYSLQYARKKVKDLTKKYNLAKQLWG